MTVKTKLKAALVAGLFLVSLGGYLLHDLAHAPDKFDYGYVPAVVGLVSVFLVPLFFCFRKTIHAAYLLNGVAVILGTIAMLHFGILTKKPLYIDILILWPKFLMGYALYHIEMLPLDAALKLGWKAVRYPHFGFWVWHLLSLGTVYTLGALLWS